LLLFLLFLSVSLAMQRARDLYSTESFAMVHRLKLGCEITHSIPFPFGVCAQRFVVLQAPLAKILPVPINWQHIAALSHAIAQNVPPAQLKPLIIAARASVSNGELTAKDPKSYHADEVERRSLRHLALAALAVLQFAEHEASTVAAALERGSKVARQCLKDKRALDADVGAAQASASKVRFQLVCWFAHSCILESAHCRTADHSTPCKTMSLRRKWVMQMAKAVANGDLSVLKGNRQLERQEMSTSSKDMQLRLDTLRVSLLMLTTCASTSC
jgi:hypothetical protein